MEIKDYKSPPGQMPLLQETVLVNGPSQFLPPFLGIGFVQERVSTCVPVAPQLMEHTPADQSERPPSTGRNSKGFNTGSRVFMPRRNFSRPKVTSISYIVEFI